MSPRHLPLRPHAHWLNSFSQSLGLQETSLWRGRPWMSMTQTTFKTLYKQRLVWFSGYCRLIAGEMIVPSAYLHPLLEKGLDRRESVYGRYCCFSFPACSCLLQGQMGAKFFPLRMVSLFALCVVMVSGSQFPGLWFQSPSFSSVSLFSLFSLLSLPLSSPSSRRSSKACWCPSLRQAWVKVIAVCIGLCQGIITGVVLPHLACIFSRASGSPEVGCNDCDRRG